MNEIQEKFAVLKWEEVEELNSMLRFTKVINQCNNSKW